MHIWNQHTLGLFCRTLCNLLPTLYFLRSLFAIQLHNTAFRLYWNDFIRTKLNCLLYDQFHLICFWQSLKEVDSARQFIIWFLCINNVKKHFICTECLYRTAVFFLSTITDPDFLSLFHTKYIGNMVDIRSNNMNLMCRFIDLMWLYKKSLHEISPFLQLRIPTHPVW